MTDNHQKERETLDPHIKPSGISLAEKWFITKNGTRYIASHFLHRSDEFKSSHYEKLNWRDLWKPLQGFGRDRDTQFFRAEITRTSHVVISKTYKDLQSLLPYPFHPRFRSFTPSQESRPFGTLLSLRPSPWNRLFITGRPSRLSHREKERGLKRRHKWREKFRFVRKWLGRKRGNRKSVSFPPLRFVVDQRWLPCREWFASCRKLKQVWKWLLLGSVEFVWIVI